MDVSARVSHAGNFLDGAGTIQLGIARKRIGLQHAGEVCKMPLRMLATSIGCVGK